MVYLGLPINSMVIFHGELLNNQMVIAEYQTLTTRFGLFCRPHRYDCKLTERMSVKYGLRLNKDKCVIL